MLEYGRLTWKSSGRSVFAFYRTVHPARIAIDLVLPGGLLKESFRLTQACCDRTDQTDKLKAQSWYSFARILVNYLSHSFRLELRRSDRNQLPTTFPGYTLNLATEGEVIELPLEVLVCLADEITRFTAQGLR